MANNPNQIGALWLNTDKNGDQYFSGKINSIHGDIPVVIFMNGYKEEDKHPDWLIYRSEPQGGGGQSQSGSMVDGQMIQDNPPQNRGKTNEAKGVDQSINEQYPDDEDITPEDIPF